MRVEDNFTAITPVEMVDPVLKLAMRMGRTHMDGPNPEPSIDIYYDPEIHSDRFLVPMPADDRMRREKYGWPIPNGGLVAFRSHLRKEVFGFNLTETHENDNQVLTVSQEGRDIDVAAKLLCKLNAPKLSDYPYNVIEYLSLSILRLFSNFDPNPLFQGKRPKQRLLLVPRSFAKRMPSRSLARSSPVSEALILFDTREIT